MPEVHHLVKDACAVLLHELMCLQVKHAEVDRGNSGQCYSVAAPQRESRFTFYAVPCASVRKLKKTGLWLGRLHRVKRGIASTRHRDRCTGPRTRSLVIRAKKSIVGSYGYFVNRTRTLTSTLFVYGDGDKVIQFDDVSRSRRTQMTAFGLRNRFAMLRAMLDICEGSIEEAGQLDIKGIVVMYNRKLRGGNRDLYDRHSADTGNFRNHLFYHVFHMMDQDPKVIWAWLRWGHEKVHHCFAPMSHIDAALHRAVMMCELHSAPHDDHRVVLCDCVTLTLNLNAGITTCKGSC